MSHALGAALVGIDGVPVEVEVCISSLLPRVDIVGLPEASVRESTARVRAAIAAVGHRFPDRRVTVNLAPAAVRKTGAGLDLPIALGILAAAGSIPAGVLEARAFVGELALDGRLRPVRGALALVLSAAQAGCREVFVPRRNGPESALVPGLSVRPADDLGQVLAHLLEAELLPEATPTVVPSELPLEIAPCLSEVRGQQAAKRALEVAAAGGHAMLLYGPPGAGKTMLARRLAPLLPPLSAAEALEATRIHGAAAMLDSETSLVRTRPFRAPHHSASTAGLLGGGNPPRPGEVSLAHRGVLFLDELPEFERRSLEALRQVLEERRVQIARAGITCRFPADFQLIAACNPCPCGWHGSELRDCRCDEGVIERYRRRLSGPLLDRIDIHVSLRRVPWSELDSPAAGHGEPSARVAERVARVRRGNDPGRPAVLNAAIADRDLDERARATPQARSLLGRAVDALGLSARAARRALRIARTIADLAGEADVGADSIAEALSYRAPDSGRLDPS